MSVKKSSQKVRVTRLFGGSANAGYMDPEVNMQVKYGISDYWIVGLQSGNYTVDLALASGGTAVHRIYPELLVVESSVATYFGFPGSTDSVEVAHGVTWPNGVPGSEGVSGSGMAYAGGDDIVHTFSR